MSGSMRLSAKYEQRASTFMDAIWSTKAFVRKDFLSSCYGFCESSADFSRTVGLSAASGAGAVQTTRMPEILSTKGL
jgi:hypothetical protein